MPETSDLVAPPDHPWRSYSPWRSFALYMVLGAAFGAFLLTAFNVLVDDRSLIFTDYKSSEAVNSYVDTLLASGRPLHYPSYDYDRAVKNQIAASTPATCLVTGSSREMQMGLQNMSGFKDHGCASFSNLAVSGGSLEDFAILANIIASEAQKRIVFVGLSPWMMQFGSDHRSFENRPAVSAAARMFDLPVDGGQRLAQSLRTVASLEYTRINLLSLLKDQTAAKNDNALALSVAKPIGSGDASLNPDGTLNYPATYTDSDSTRQIGNGSYKLEAADSADARGALIRIIEHLQRAGHRILFVLTPYHPRVWASDNVTIKTRLMDAEAVYRDIGQRLGIDMIGGYDPRPFGLSEQDFLDDLHPRRDAFVKLR